MPTPGACRSGALQSQLKPAGVCTQRCWRQRTQQAGPPAALPINRPCCSAVPGIVQWQASWAQHSVPQLCCCPPRASKDAGPFRSCTPFIRNTAHRPMWVAQKTGGRDSRNDGSHKETDTHVVRDRNHEHCTTEKEGQGDEKTSHQKSATGVVQTSQGAALPYSFICSAI